MRHRLTPASAVALVIAFTALLAATSHGAPLWAPLQGPPSRLAVLAAAVVLCGVGGVGLVVVAALIHRAIGGGRRDAPSFRTTVLRTLPLAAVTIATAALLMIGRAEPAERAKIGERPQHPMKDSDRRARPLSIDWWTSNVIAGEGLPEVDTASDSGPAPDAQIPLLLVLAGGIAAAAGAAALWRQSSREEFVEPDEDPAGANGEAVHGAVVGTIDTMLADPDPNTAIRGAYAQLLQGLDDCGTGRHAHEGPVEHIRRVLTVLRVRQEPLRRLIRLFELARFSTHLLGADDRDDALAALRAVATDLSASTTAVPTPARPAVGPGTRT